MKRIWLSLLAAAAALAATAWATDFVTPQGELTVYTADCEGGTWQGAHCPARLVPGPRYRFRALMQHREVLFWIVASNEPSGKYTDCQVLDGRNWTCKITADTSRTITHAVLKGQPVADPASPARKFHTISKWRWLLLRYGIPSGSNADS